MLVSFELDNTFISGVDDGGLQCTFYPRSCALRRSCVYDTYFRYENPFITATSRSVISDIYSLARQLCYVDVPKPLAMLYILLRLKPPDMPRTSSGSDSWFQGLRVWTEIGDICESESFGVFLSS